MQGLALAMRSQTADRQRVYLFAFLKLRNYWTEVHQNFTWCCRIIADEVFESK